MIKTVKILECPNKLALAKAIKDVIGCPGPTATTLATNQVITLNDCPMNETHWTEIVKLVPELKWSWICQGNNDTK